VTGEVLPPGLVETEDAVTVTFTVEPQAPGSARCPGNDWVPYEVQLDQPLGERVLIDGACASEEAGGTSFCSSGQIRWPTEASCPDALPVPVDIPLQVTTQLPDGDVRVHGEDPQWLIPVGPAGAAVTVLTTGEPGVAVLEVRYELEDPRSDVVRRFPGATAQPTTIRWDGTDANGVPVPPGRYQLRYRAVVGRDVRPCQDRTGAQVGGGLGWFVVAD